ncbi:hypothetical protein [Sphingomonas sp. RS2018]
MDTKICATIAVSLMLAACGPSGDGNAPAEVPVAPETIATDDRVETPVAPASTPPAPIATPTPPTLTPEAERGVKGARNLLLDFARMIERKDFDGARALLSATDQQRWSRSAFAALFDGLGTVTVAVPTGTMEGAAGSSYYTAPVTITGDAPGAGTIRGEAVLRRVNDVDGATPAQLRWHFETLTLSPATRDQ